MLQKSTLPGAFDRQAYLIALLVFIAGSTNAAVVPFIGFYIIQVLGHPPATVGFYSVTAALASIAASRVYGERVDAGVRVRPLLMLSVCGAFVAAAAASFGHMALLVAITATGMGLSNAASTLIFSYGRYHGRVKALDTAAYNAFLRTMVSLAWMLVPAAAYLIFDLAGAKAVFVNAMLMAVIWGGLALAVVPRDQTSPMERRQAGDDDTGRNLPLLLAAAASFCMSFAHALCASALPVFLVREVGLPDYVPGLSLSVKCAMEVLFILLAPRMMRRFSARLLLGVSAVMAIVAFNVIASVATLPAMIAGAALEGAYYGLCAGTCLTFVQGFARAMGVDEPVTSPTFALVHNYAGRAPVLHADLYRMVSEHEVLDLGIDEALADGAIALVEWGDIASNVLSPDRLTVTITDVDETSRAFDLDGWNDRWAQ